MNLDQAAHHRQHPTGCAAGVGTRQRLRQTNNPAGKGRGIQNKELSVTKHTPKPAPAQGIRAQVIAWNAQQNARRAAQQAQK